MNSIIKSVDQVYSVSYGTYKVVGTTEDGETVSAKFQDSVLRDCWKRYRSDFFSDEAEYSEEKTMSMLKAILEKEYRKTLNNNQL
jgi:hypothetical protein